jgi:hypothetical protein
MSSASQPVCWERGEIRTQITDAAISCLARLSAMVVCTEYLICVDEVMESPILCLSEIKLAHTDDEVRREMA